MRIVIDLQGAQTESRFRGIGRYSLELALAIATGRGPHEVFVALNGALRGSIDDIRAAFAAVLPLENIKVWSLGCPVFEVSPDNSARRDAAELIREGFLQSLHPDVVLVTSLFEGMGDDAVTSVGRLPGRVPTAVVLYDLIPLLNPDINFRTNQVYIDWYARKIASIRRADQLLAISESSRQEGLRGLSFDAERVINISAGYNATFSLAPDRTAASARIRLRYNLERFLLYTGGADERKNLFRLIEAFARVAAATADDLSLVIAGKIDGNSAAALQAHAVSHGLDTRKLRLLGYVEDADLEALYGACEVFVFPSTHEGFGIPPLEAMASGAVVISSNATSLPEVVGDAEALFDPLNVDDIASAMRKALFDDAFRQRRVRHGLAQVGRFSWAECGGRALAALERLASSVPASMISEPVPVRRYDISNFAPKASRILVVKLDHLGDFLLAVPALAKLRARFPYARLEAAVGSWCRDIAESLPYFSEVHTLDFFRKASVGQPGLSEHEIDTFIGSLGHFDIAVDLRRPPDTRFITAKVHADLIAGYRSRIVDIDRRLHVCLDSAEDLPYIATATNGVHISAQMLALVDALPGSALDYIKLPDLFGLPRPDPEARRGAVAMFPYAGNSIKQWPRRQFEDLITAILQRDSVGTISLFFTNQDEADAFGRRSCDRVAVHVGAPIRELCRLLARHEVCVANNSFGAHLGSYLDCRVVAVYGGHEAVSEWAPVFSSGVVLSRPTECSPCHLSSTAACPYDMACLDIPVPAVLAAINGFQGKVPTATSVTPLAGTFESRIEDVICRRITDGMFELRERISAEDKLTFARDIARNLGIGRRGRQLLVDVSELVRADARSGIQRVVRAVLTHLLADRSHGYMVEPVYASVDRLGYRYARKLKSQFEGELRTDIEEAPAEAWPGDLFLGLDLHPLIVREQVPVLDEWRARGVKVTFVVYDLLPVLFPDYFPDGAREGHEQWLETISRYDGLICISQAVLEETRSWLEAYANKRSLPIELSSFTLGSDIGTTAPSRGVPLNAPEVLGRIRQSKAFLMVGTIEPRKAHGEVLAAFELLWARGRNDLSLTFVGKRGWMVEELCSHIQLHERLGESLFWIDDGSDEYLDLVYREVDCLIAASHGEGFGLPLVEAARLGIPAIARDIPVFREVAGATATYFDRQGGPAAIAAAVEAWASVRGEGRADFSAGGNRPPARTWKESTSELLHRVFHPQVSVLPTNAIVFRATGADRRLRTWVGAQLSGALRTTGVAGNLMFGPYIEAKRGHYALALTLDVEETGGDVWFDVVVDSGRLEVLTQRVDAETHGRVTLPARFQLMSDVSDLEVRLFVSDRSRLAVLNVVILAEPGRGGADA